MIERGQLAERVANPEIPSSPGHYAGLHPRLLMGGEFLNPAKQDIPAITSQQLGDFQHRDYSPFSNASLQERINYWNQRYEANYEARYQAWVTGCVATFNNAKAFFKDTDKGKSWSELYEKLGIKTQDFTSQTAEGLYNRYFQPNTPGIQLFVRDILSVHMQQDDRINMASLEANLAAVGWLSHIFGNVSSEVITQMVMAEAKLHSNPNQLVEQANKKTGTNPSRINNLNTDEQKILKFLWDAPKMPSVPAQPTPRTPSQPTSEDDVKFKYERLGDPRVFPIEGKIGQLLNPVKVAIDLKETKKQIYGQVPTDQLAQEIAFEQAQLTEWRNSKGLTDKYLVAVVSQAINQYRRFLTEKYGVNLPTIKNIQLAAISGKTVEMFGLPPGVFAFVQPVRNAIFMNFDVIFAAARKMAEARHIELTGQEMFRQMTPQETKEMITNLLYEVHPHEFTHLVADIAFWKKIEKSNEELVGIETGKVGLSVSKPVKIDMNNQTHWIFKQRGTPLMEAVTVELTDQWAKSIHDTLAIPAYEAERGVLHELTRLLAREQGISEEEAFKKVVVGYFTPEGFRNLAEELSGKVVDINKKGIPHQGVAFKRPHFMQIVYALMEYEMIKAAQQRIPLDYALTKQYIKSANNLSGASEAFKKEIANLVRVSKPLVSPIQLSPKALDYLDQQGIQIGEK